jgi:hypothetical protein
MKDIRFPPPVLFAPRYFPCSYQTSREGAAAVLGSVPKNFIANGLKTLLTETE